MSNSYDTIPPPGYTILQKLGEGGYGSVYLCREKATGKELAVKQLEAGDKGIPAIMEANIMSTINHPNLVHSEKIIADNKYLWLFQEKARCDLGYWVRKKKHLPSPYVLRIWAYSLAQAVACLHQQNIVHGDVKGSNVLLFPTPNNNPREPQHLLRLSDFNLSQKVWSEDRDVKLRYKSCTCTHRPLEIWLDKEWDFSVDIWSLGCTLFEMAYGTYLFPYQGDFEEKTPDRETLKERFLCCIDDFAKKGPGGVQELGNLSFQRERLQYHTFHIPPSYHSPEYARFNSLIMAMLKINPLERLTISEVLDHPYFRDFLPMPYETITANEEYLCPKKEKAYTEQLRSYTPHEKVIAVTLSLLRKIQHIRFRYPNFEDDKLRLLGTYWLAYKLVLRRPPTLSYQNQLLFRIERKICEYLSFRLII